MSRSGCWCIPSVMFILGMKSELIVVPPSVGFIIPIPFVYVVLFVLVAFELVGVRGVGEDLF